MLQYAIITQYQLYRIIYCIIWVKPCLFFFLLFLSRTRDIGTIFFILTYITPSRTIPSASAVVCSAFMRNVTQRGTARRLIARVTPSGEPFNAYRPAVDALTAIAIMTRLNRFFFSFTARVVHLNAALINHKRKKKITKKSVFCTAYMRDVSSTRITAAALYYIFIYARIVYTCI